MLNISMDIHLIISFILHVTYLQDIPGAVKIAIFLAVLSSVMPRSHIHGLEAGLATDVHSWQSVLVRSFLYCIRNHT